MTTDPKSIAEEISKVRANLSSKLRIEAATNSFLTAIYEKTPYRRIKVTLTFPDGYPEHALIVKVENGGSRSKKPSIAVPPGLKKKLDKDLNQVAHEHRGTFHQAESVLMQLIQFVDTNKFVSCWKELRQVVDSVQTLALTTTGKGSTIAINDTKGLIRVRLEHAKYYYSCSIYIDDNYPSTMTHIDWGKACKVVASSTNLPNKISTMMTAQAQEVVRRMQDGMSAHDAVIMSNPMAPPPPPPPPEGDDAESNTAGNNSNNNSRHPSSETTTKTKGNDTEQEERHWKSEEEARLANYTFSEYDGSNPQPSLHPLVTFLMNQMQQLPEQACPICHIQSFPTDPATLQSMYDNSSTSTVSEMEKKKRRQVRLQRPERTLCGCWYHYTCLHTFLTEPPFGAACPVDGRRVYHPDWPSDTAELERAYAAKEAKRREIEDAAMCF